MNYPKVSIIVTSYFEKTKPYLDLCVESIRNLSYPNFDVTIVTKPSYVPQYEGCRTIYPNIEKFYNPVGENYAIKNTDGEYIFLLNDDVILTKDCLQPLVHQVQAGNCILMPLLSCHNNFRYNLIMGYNNNGSFHPITKRFNRMEDWGPIKNQLMNAQSVYPPGILNETKLCMVAPLFSRKTYEIVGPFDEDFKGGPEDIDYSLRAIKKQIRLGICLDSLVWHFGGATTSDIPLNDPLRDENKQIFFKKWGFYP